jgi:exonuclease III
MSSQFKMHEVWRILLNKQWDVLCTVEHKAHANAGLLTCSHGYTLCYAGKDPGSYSGIIMFIRTHYNPQIILNDDFGRYMVVQIAYGQLIWLVGVYASNVLRECKLLWQSLASLLRDGRPGLLMGDFNVVKFLNQLLNMLLWIDRRLKHGNNYNMMCCTKMYGHGFMGIHQDTLVNLLNMSLCGVD